MWCVLSLFLAIDWVKHVAPTLRKPNQLEFQYNDHNYRYDVLKGYLWIYSPRHKIRKALLRSNFSYLSGNFSSRVTFNLMVNIVNNTTKTQNFQEFQKAWPFSVRCIGLLEDFTNQDSNWVHKDQSLDTSLYYKDCLHLTESGNDKPVSKIVKMLTKLNCQNSFLTP